MMKLVMAFVHDIDGNNVINALSRQGYQATKLASTGGFLKAGNTTLMIGVDKEKVEETLDIIKSKSSTRKEFMVIPSTLPGYADSSPTPVQVTLGGATVFIVDVEQFYRF